MTQQEMTALVQKQLDAYNSRDIDAFCKFFHPEVKVVNLVSGSVRCSNIEDFRKGYEEMFSQSPNLHCELKSRIVLDEVVIDEELVTGIQGDSKGVHVAAIYAFRDGLIDRVWFPK